VAGTYRTEAIILSRTNFGEADRILTLLTPNGKIRAIAKGSRKIKSRSGGHIELFGQVDLMLAQGRNMDVLTSARLIWYPHSLGGDYDRLSYAYLFGSMINKLVDESEPHPEMYGLLLDSLAALDTTGTSALLEIWFKLRLANELGYHPQLDGCVVCGESNVGASYFFSAERGGIVDTTCRSIGDIELSQNTIKLWRLMMTQSFKTISAVAGAEQLANDSLTACDTFYEFHLGRAFKPSLSLST
jgi:DNA repair protein RecO (recombination protein O)